MALKIAVSAILQKKQSYQKAHFTIILKEKFALEAMNEFIDTFPEKKPSKNIEISTFTQMIDRRIESIIKINFAKECYMSVMCHSFSEQNDVYRKEICIAIENS